jgi:DNA helicase-2/ATP-dependent DNA helicase PcrA
MPSQHARVPSARVSRPLSALRRVLVFKPGGATAPNEYNLWRGFAAELIAILLQAFFPFVKFGGLKFLDTAHVKDILAILRFIENPRDRVAGFRLLNLLPGVGPASAKRVLDAIVGCADPIGALCSQPVPPRAGADWASFVEMIGSIRDARWPADLELARLWYEPHLERIHEDAEIRHPDLIQLEQIASGYPSRERFLTELTLDPPDATSDQAGVPLLARTT